MIEELSDDEILRRLEGDVSPSSPPSSQPRYLRPLKEVAEDLIDALAIDVGIGLGLTEIDVLTRGFRPTDLALITGFAHSGKTQLVNTMVLNNKAKRILFFSLDDPAEMILGKLAAMHTHIPAERIEQRIREGEPEAQRGLRELAEGVFPNLLIVDDVMDGKAMQEATAEATDYWGAYPDAVILDYVEMITYEGATLDPGARVKYTINNLKRWAKAAEYPIIALHQGTRSKAAPGEAISMQSMGYSGEQQATFVIGCRRKRDLESLDEHDRAHHEHTITLHLVKNKRPGGRLTHYEGVDFHMDAPTGLITPLTGVDQLVSVARQLEMQ